MTSSKPDFELPHNIDTSWVKSLEFMAQQVPDKPAFIFEGPGWEDQFSFAEWRDRAREIAAGLQALGVGRGDFVGVASPGSPIYPLVQIACGHLGAVLLPINIRYRRDELVHILRTARPRVVFALTRLRKAEIVAQLRDALEILDADEPEDARGFTRIVEFASLDACATGWPDPSVESETSTGDEDWRAFLETARSTELSPIDVRGTDPALLQFTSGTTSFPKGALLAHRSCLGDAYYLGIRMGIDDSDVFFNTQPYYHVGGTVGATLMAVTRGCTIISPERYHVTEALRMIPRHGCTARCGTPEMYAMELGHPGFSRENYASVTKGWAGGSRDALNAIKDRMGMSNLITIYGLSESSSTSTTGEWRDSFEVRCSSQGRPLPGLEISIGLEDGTTAEMGQTGEILVRGWAVMIGYWADEEATNRALDADGWLHTGDVGLIDADGCLHFVDRLKDMIKPGGENVSCAEVERVVAQVPGVKMAAVVGAPDDRLGEVPVAFVERLADAAVTEEEIIDYCTQAIASFKVPRAVFFVSDWPMTESGKIRKPELRERVRAAGGASPGAEVVL